MRRELLTVTYLLYGEDMQFIYDMSHLASRFTSQILDWQKSTHTHKHTNTHREVKKMGACSRSHIHSQYTTVCRSSMHLRTHTECNNEIQAFYFIIRKRHKSV